jgi:2'-5' RNA ligase
LALFTAFRPPEEVADAVASALAIGAPDERLRWSGRDRWHVTLGFYGSGDEPGARAAWLSGRLAGRPAPRVRLTGSGTFPGVLWLGVEGEGLAALAEAAGSGLEPRAYRPHLTLARFPREDPPGRWERLLAGFGTEYWLPGEVQLLQSVGESPYRVMGSWTLG